jgi:hypothetical protein
VRADLLQPLTRRSCATQRRASRTGIAHPCCHAEGNLAVTDWYPRFSEKDNTMHAFLSVCALVVPLFTSSHKTKVADGENSKRYACLSRFTDPKGSAALLDDLPDDVPGIVRVVRQQIIHPDAAVRHEDGGKERCDKLKVWPPKLVDVLKALEDTAPHNLRERRQPGKRVVGACTLCSYFVAGLLRYRLIPARVRVGYLRDVEPSTANPLLANGDRERMRSDQDLHDDVHKTVRDVEGCARRSDVIGRYSEHWVCEFWDGQKLCWQLLDCNQFVSGGRRRIEKPGERRFEYAAEAWKRMRRGEKVFSDDYEEGPVDSRARVRSQLLWDFASLLNHDLAGCEGDSADTRRFMEDKKYSELSARELQELDQLADLMAGDPVIHELVRFYRKSPTLRIESAENDPYSYVYR